MVENGTEVLVRKNARDKTECCLHKFRGSGLFL